MTDIFTEKAVSEKMRIRIEENKRVLEKKEIDTGKYVCRTPFEYEEIR